MSIDAALWQQVKMTERGLSGEGPLSPLAVEFRPGRVLQGDRLGAAVTALGGVLTGGGRGWARAQMPACRVPQLSLLPGVGEMRLAGSGAGRGQGRVAFAAALALVLGAGLTYAAMTHTWPFEPFPPAPAEDREIIWDKHSPRPADNDGEIRVAGLESYKEYLRTEPATPAPLKGPAASAAESRIAGRPPDAAAQPTATAPPAAAPTTLPAAPEASADPESRRASPGGSTTAATPPAAAKPREAAPPVIKPGEVTPSPEVAERVQALYQAGLRAYKRGDLKVAVLHWRKALALDSGRVGLRRSLGLVLYEMGRHDQAVAEFLAILRDHPDDREALATLELIQQQGIKKPSPPSTEKRR